MKRMGLAIVCAAALTVACNSNARTDNRTDTDVVGTAGEAERNAVQDNDKDFVNQQLSGGMAEVELGRMASERAVNADVKKFAQMMVEDHTKAGNELTEVAARFSIAATPQIDEKHRDLMEKLSKLRGNEFDREYINAMVDGHEDVVDALETRVDSTAGLKDRVTNNDTAANQVTPEKTDNAPKAAVNAWATKALPTVRHHLDEAKKLDDRLDSPQSTRK
jgi:putative membrane protein